MKKWTGGSQAECQCTLRWGLVLLSLRSKLHFGTWWGDWTHNIIGLCMCVYTVCTSMCMSTVFIWVQRQYEIGMMYCPCNAPVACVCQLQEDVRDAVHSRTEDLSSLQHPGHCHHPEVWRHEVENNISSLSVWHKRLRCFCQVGVTHSSMKLLDFTPIHTHAINAFWISASSLWLEWQ